MTEQPDVLLLAALLECRENSIDEQAAAELRRLHEFTRWQDDRIARLRAVADHRNALAGEQMDRADKLETANKELLNVVRSVVDWLDAPGESAFSDSQLAAARAAIAKHGGEA